MTAAVACACNAVAVGRIHGSSPVTHFFHTSHGHISASTRTPPCDTSTVGIPRGAPQVIHSEIAPLPSGTAVQRGYLLPAVVSVSTLLRPGTPAEPSEAKYKRLVSVPNVSTTSPHTDDIRCSYEQSTVAAHTLDMRAHSGSPSYITNNLHTHV